MLCFDPLAGGGNDGREKPPEPPSIKNISYYQALIKKAEVNIDNCKELLEMIKKDWKNGSINDENYQMLIDQTSAWIYTYQAEINQYQYQILLLEKQDNDFTLKQILQGIIIVTEKINNLEESLKLKEKYPKDYPDSELNNIRNDIKKTNDIKKMLLKLKKEEENKCGN